MKHFLGKISGAARLAKAAAPITLPLVLLAAVEGAQVSKEPARFDVILRHGTILDGTGGRPYRGDVGVRNGRIAATGDLAGRQAVLDLDVNGLFVAPGFINVHSHAVPSALTTAENMLTQGVTTEILNPDGGGSTDIARQLAESSAAGLAINIGACIGFNSVWAAVVGSSNRRPTAEEIDRMRGLVARNLEQGAWGVSAGLDYRPGYFAHTEEVIKVVQVAAPWRTNFPNHERLTPETGYSCRAGMAETIRIGQSAGVIPVITHMKIQGREQGSAAAVIGMMRQAAAEGHYVAADAYPYLAGQTGLGALLVPVWAQEGGREEMLKRFKDPALRRRIVAQTEEAMKARLGGFQGIYLPQTQRRLTDIMRDLDASPGEAVLQTLEKENVTAIMSFGIEDDLVKILQNPVTAIACDCGASAETRTHPRYYGTFPRVLGHYVRQTKALTWEDAVRRMTGLPANIVGMVDRGFLVPGMAADVTVFDPRTVIDHATYDHPAQLSEGIRYVLVNGHLALRDGELTGERGGRAMTRSRHMPSRPMSTDLARKVSVKGTVVCDQSGQGGAPAKVQIALSVTQDGGGGRAKGSFRLSDLQSKTVIRTSHLGLLQVADQWASFTGRARVFPSGEERSITVIVDQSDPLAAGHGATVVVDAEGLDPLAGSMDRTRVRVSHKERK